MARPKRESNPVPPGPQASALYQRLLERPYLICYFKISLVLQQKQFNFFKKNTDFLFCLQRGLYHFFFGEWTALAVTGPRENQQQQQQLQDRTRHFLA